MSELYQVIVSTKENFERISDINFAKESEFAMQALNANSFLMSTALENKESLKSAIVNLSACNLSLNPVLKLAYLVPRNKKVCLDISYLGLQKLATDSGSVVLVKSGVVRQSDEFILNGIDKAPSHNFKPFATDRGDIVGAYTVAKLASGDFLTEIMTIDEILDIRDRTEAYKSFKAGKTKSCPWTTDLEEMLKKTVIRRSSKSWPKTERLASALSVLNEHEGIDFEKEKSLVDVTPASIEDLEVLEVMLSKIENGEKRLIKHINDKDKVAYVGIDELTSAQAKYSINFLDKNIKRDGK